MLLQWARGGSASVTDISKKKCQCQEKGREIFSLSLFFCDTRATSFIHLLDRRLQEHPRREVVPRQ